MWLDETVKMITAYWNEEMMLEFYETASCVVIHPLSYVADSSKQQI